MLIFPVFRWRSVLLGAAALGIYSRGWMLIGLPVYLLTTSISKVVFSSFSQVQTDRPRLRTVYLCSITLIAALVIPICAGAAVAGPARLDAGQHHQPRVVRLARLCVTAFARLAGMCRVIEPAVPEVAELLAHRHDAIVEPAAVGDDMAVRLRLRF